MPVSSTRDGWPNRENLRQSKPSFLLRRRTARGTSSRAGHREVDETRTDVRLGTIALSDVTGDVRASPHVRARTGRPGRVERQVSLTREGSPVVGRGGSAVWMVPGRQNTGGWEWVASR